MRPKSPVIMTHCWAKEATFIQRRLEHWLPCLIKTGWRFTLMFIHIFVYLYSNEIPRTWPLEKTEGAYRVLSQYKSDTAFRSTLSQRRYLTIFPVQQKKKRCMSRFPHDIVPSPMSLMTKIKLESKEKDKYVLTSRPLRLIQSSSSCPYPILFGVGAIRHLLPLSSILRHGIIHSFL